jgi:hypothetical protein
MLTTEHPQPDSYALMTLTGRLALRPQVRTRTRVVRVIGQGRVSGIEIEHIDSGRREVVACDTVVFTGDWIPDHELFRAAGIALDPGSLGPRVDSSLRTLREGVFTAGNCAHPVDTADVAALDGVHVADAVLAHLRGDRVAAEPVDIVAEPPFRWVSPSLMRPGDAAPARGRLLLWSDELRHAPLVVARQSGRRVGAVRLPWPAAPGRVFRVPWRLLAAVAADSGPVTISLG